MTPDLTVAIFAPMSGLLEKSVMKTPVCVFLFSAGLFSGCSTHTEGAIQSADAAPVREVDRSESAQCADQVKALSREPQDSKKPLVDLLFWCTKAAEKGDANAQWIMGGLYDRGLGVTESRSDAFKWYRKSAENGHAEAQFKIGQMYGKGEGTTLDRSEATRWYLKAANQGHIEAQYYMGYRFEHGKGVTQNFSEAHHWYLKAAEQGSPSAMHGLGEIYLRGQGVPQNQIEAYKWFNLAAVSGQREFVAARDRLAKKISTAQLAEGQKLSSECVKKHPSMRIGGI